jgi:signal transduction histidine kinase
MVVSDDDGIAIRVIDAGENIDEATARTLFEPFSRGPNPYGRAVEGYGIGLAVSRRMAEMHGATLTLKANAGRRGSIAELVLPKERVLAPVSTAASDL